MIRRLLLPLMLILTAPVRAQSIPNPVGTTGCTGGTIPLGVIWSIEQWTTAFGCKADVTNGTLNGPTITGGTISGPAISNPTITGTIGSGGNWTFSPSSGRAITVNAPNSTTLAMDINGAVQIAAPSAVQALNVNGGVGFTAPTSGLAFQVDNAANTAQLFTLGFAGGVNIGEPASGIALTVTGNSNDTINAINNGGGASFVATLNVPGSGLEVATPAATSANVFSLNQGGQANWVLNNTPTTNFLVLEAAAGGTSWSPAGNVSIANPSSGPSLTLEGSGVFNDGLTVNGPLTSTGGATFSGSGVGIIRQNLTVLSPTSGQSLSINNNANTVQFLSVNAVTGQIEIGNQSTQPAVIVSGAMTVSSGALTADNGLVVSGGAQIGGGITAITDGLTVSGGALTASSGLISDAGLQVSGGSTVIDGVLTVSGGAITAQNGIVSDAGLNVTGGSTAVTAPFSVSGVSVFNEQTAAWTMGSGCASSTNINILFQQSGNTVTMFFPAITCTASGAAEITLTGSFPAGMTPARAQLMPIVPMEDNSALAMGVIEIMSGTEITLSTLAASLSGTVGFLSPGVTVTYTLD